MLGCMKPMSSPMMNRMLGLSCWDGRGCCACAKLGVITRALNPSVAATVPNTRRPRNARLILFSLVRATVCLVQSQWQTTRGKHGAGALMLAAAALAVRSDQRLPLLLKEKR